MMRSTTFVTHTFGCKVNTYDSGLLQKSLESHGYVHKRESSSVPEVHLLNSCAVTHEASKEALRVIRKIKSKNPLAKIVLTGCAAQVDTEMFENVPAIDLIVANSHKGMLPFLIDDLYKGTLKQKVFKSNIFKKESLEAGGGIEEAHTRSFLKIQDGCNSFCTYCVIPYARGKSRSIPIDQLVMRISELERSGVQEVVLTGVHIGDYEDETGGRKRHLEELVENLLVKTRVPRFRLSSLEPVEVTPRLLDLYSDGRMCPHFHMSIQSAQTQVLSDMKRKYSSEDVVRSLEEIRARVPGSFVGMDVITGFPTETEELFEETFQNLVKTPWTKIHVFPYSERPGTRAAKLESSVRREIRVKRADRLRELSLMRCNQQAKEQLGSVKKVLLLKSKEGKDQQSLSRDYWPVIICAKGAALTDAKGAELTDAKGADGRSAGISLGSKTEIDVKITDLKYSSTGECLLIGEEVCENV